MKWNRQYWKWDYLNQVGTYLMRRVRTETQCLNACLAHLSISCTFHAVTVYLSLLLRSKTHLDICVHLRNHESLKSNPDPIKLLVSTEWKTESRHWLVALTVQFRRMTAIIIVVAIQICPTAHAPEDVNIIISTHRYASPSFPSVLRPPSSFSSHLI